MDPYQTIAERIAPGSRVHRIWPLTGGVSATLEALELARPNGTWQRVVIRRHEHCAFKPRHADVAIMEHALLRALYDRRLPVPQPRLLDITATLLGSPFVVMDFIESTPPPADTRKVARHMAEVLARIHSIPPASIPASLPGREDPIFELVDRLSLTTDHHQLRDVLMARGPIRGSVVLLHGDFWPGNLLWRDGRIAAVLDWEDAAQGDPLSDLACARVELLCATDESAMNALTDEYLRITQTNSAALAIWDLYVSTTALASMDQWGLAPDDLAARKQITRMFQDHARARVLASG